MRIGTRDLNAFRAANGGSDSELALDATLPEMLKDPLTRRALGLADASAVAAFFVPYIMTNEEVLRVEHVEEKYRDGGMLTRMVGAH